ncbi:MAG: putative quinol monooxygenase [Phycisphaerales bacterium]
MPESPVIVIARVVALPGKAEDLRAVLESLVAPTRAEPGCIKYDLVRDRENAGVFTFVEEWTDDAALDRHFQTPHFIAAGERLGPLVAEAPEIRRCVTVR